MLKAKRSKGQAQAAAKGSGELDQEIHLEIHLEILENYYELIDSEL